MSDAPHAQRGILKTTLRKRGHLEGGGTYDQESDFRCQVTADVPAGERGYAGGVYSCPARLMPPRRLVESPRPTSWGRFIASARRSRPGSPALTRPATSS